MDEKKIGYCYIKGNTYTENQFCYDGDELLHAIDKTFNNYDEMLQFVTKFSDYYSIAIQFYY